MPFLMPATAYGFLKKRVFLLSIALLLHSACTSLRESSKYDFRSAAYYTSIVPTAGNKVLLEVAEDTVKVYSLGRVQGREVVTGEIRHVLPERVADPTGLRFRFYNPSFDVDIISTPIKYRFAVESMPRQLSSGFNGSLYLGYRNDVYRLNYHENPLGFAERHVSHMGTSLGAFAGIASESINPWVTRDQISIEYEGAVFTTGLAWIVGINKLTAGLALGFDFLLDENRQHWIYQKKPWLGLTVGLNLN